MCLEQPAMNTTGSRCGTFGITPLARYSNGSVCNKRWAGILDHGAFKRAYRFSMTRETPTPSHP